MGPCREQRTLARKQPRRSRWGATVTTGGNIVFHGSIAYHAETGEKLWEVNLGGTLCKPISYELDGKQYIAILARANPNSRLFAFTLDGKEPIPEVTR